MAEIREQVGNYILEAGIWGYIRRGMLDTALKKLVEMVRIRTGVAKHLMQEKEWDLFVVVYTATDKVQHHFWKYIDPSRPESQQSLPYSNAIFEVYKEIDVAVGELLGAAGDASVIIMSDHGAGPSSRRSMFINRWLRKEGFLHCNESRAISKGWDRLKYNFLQKANNEIKKLFPRRIKEIMLRLFPKLRDKVDSILSLPGIDWTRTVAYSRENHPAIFVNTKGREAKGIVVPGTEYEEIRNQIATRLESLICPETGKRIVGRIFKREELYHGPEISRAPDIIFEWNEFLYVHRPSGIYLNEPFLEKLDDKALLRSEDTTRPSGIHRDQGILVALGEPFEKKKVIANARIYDIAPTILYLLDLPIPEDMDGIVLEDIITPAYLHRCPIRKQATSASVEDYYQEFAADETQAIQERLRGLGYID
jgi:predicted AlkP superfamily phosphohydrolase/phosphomutase